MSKSFKILYPSGHKTLHLHSHYQSVEELAKTVFGNMFNYWEYGIRIEEITDGDKGEVGTSGSISRNEGEPPIGAGHNQTQEGCSGGGTSEGSNLTQQSETCGGTHTEEGVTENVDTGYKEATGVQAAQV